MFSFALPLIFLATECFFVGTKVTLLPLCAEEPTISETLSVNIAAPYDSNAQEESPSTYVVPSPQSSTYPNTGSDDDSISDVDSSFNSGVDSANSFDSANALDGVPNGVDTTTNGENAGVPTGTESNTTSWLIPSRTEPTVSNESLFLPQIPAIRSGSGFLNSVPAFRGKQMLNEPFSAYSLIPRVRAEEILSAQTPVQTPVQTPSPNADLGNSPNPQIPFFSTPGLYPYGAYTPYPSGDPLALPMPRASRIPPRGFEPNSRESFWWNMPYGNHWSTNVPSVLPNGLPGTPSDVTGPSANRSQDSVQPQDSVQQFLRAEPMGNASSSPVALPETYQLQFRRIHFPVDRPELLRETGIQLVPMARKDFDQLMRPMTSANGRVEESCTASITQSSWYATLDVTTGLLRGTVVWKLDARRGTTQFLPMDPCRPAIHELLFIPETTSTNTTSIETTVPDATSTETTSTETISTETTVAEMAVAEMVASDVSVSDISDATPTADMATDHTNTTDGTTTVTDNTATPTADTNTTVTADRTAKTSDATNVDSQMAEISKPNETRVAWGRDRKGRLGVLVDGPGILYAEWTLSSDVTASAAFGEPQNAPRTFRWEVPVTLSSELILALPASLTPEFPDAIVQLLPENAIEIQNATDFPYVFSRKKETEPVTSQLVTDIKTDTKSADTDASSVPNTVPDTATNTVAVATDIGASVEARTDANRVDVVIASDSSQNVESLRYWRILFPNSVPQPNPFELSTPITDTTIATPTAAMRDASINANATNTATVESLPTTLSGQNASRADETDANDSLKNTVPVSYLRIVPDAKKEPAKTETPLGVRQWTTCMVSRQNIEIQKIFTAIPRPSQRTTPHGTDTTSVGRSQEIRGVFPESLVLCIPKNVQITDIRIGNTRLHDEYEMDEQSVTDEQKEGDGESTTFESSKSVRRLRLSIPRTLAEVGVLRIHANSPLSSDTLSTPSSSPSGTITDDSHRSASTVLPDIWLDGVFQESSMASLLVPEPLVLESLSVDDGRQVFCSPVNTPITGRNYGFQLFSPRSRIQFRLGSPTVSFFANSGTTVTFDGLSIRTLTVAECRVPEGEKFDIRLPLADGWTIESVTSEEPDSLRDWTVAPISNSVDSVSSSSSSNGTALNRGTSELLIQFRRPLQAGLPLTLRIAARGPQASIDSHWRGDELLPFLFPSSEADTWIAVRTNPVCQWRSLETTSMPRTPWGRVSESLRKLFPQPVGSLQAYADIADHLFVLEGPSDDYAVDQKIIASLVGQSLQQRVELRVLTRAPGIDHLRVHYREPQVTPPIWHVLLTQPTDTDMLEPSGALTNGDSTNDAIMTTETVSVVPVGKPVPIETFSPISMNINRSATDSEPIQQEGYTTWDLRFTQPIEHSFMLYEQRSVPLSVPQEALCVNVLTANRQTGTLTIRRPFGTAFRNHRFEALPTFSGDARFTFDPDSLPADSKVSVFTFLPPESQRVTATTIRGWESRLDVRVDSNANVHVLALWKIENEGEKELTIRLPSSWAPRDVESIYVNGRMVEPRWLESGVLRVPLPQDIRFFTVSILYTTRAVSSFHSLMATPEMPHAEIPILRRVEQVSIPTEYQLVSVSGGRYSTGQESRLSMMRRFFGISARPESEPRFSLFSWDWFHERNWFPDTQTSHETSQQWLERLSETMDAADTVDVAVSGDASPSTPTAPSTPAIPSTTFTPALSLTWGELLTATTSGVGISTSGGETLPSGAGTTRSETVAVSELERAMVPAESEPTRSEAKSVESRVVTGVNALPMVLIDRIALSEIGISPCQRVELPAGWESSATLPQSAASRGSALLQHAGMVLLVRDRTVLLTSVQRAAFSAQELTSVEGMNAWMILPGELADRIHNGMNGRDLEWIPLSVWTRLPPLSTSPWQDSESFGDSDVMISGHYFFSAERLDDQPLTIVAYHRDFLLGVEICCLLASWSGLLCFPLLLAKLRRVGRWTQRIPRRWRVFLTPETLRPRLRIAVHLTFLAILMTILLFVPESLVGVFRGTLWGTLAALWCLRRKIQVPTPPSLPDDSSKPKPQHAQPSHPMVVNTQNSETRTFASIEPEYHDLMEFPIVPSQSMDSTQDYCVTPSEEDMLAQAASVVDNATTNGENHEMTTSQDVEHTQNAGPNESQKTFVESMSNEQNTQSMTPSSHSQTSRKTPPSSGQTWLSILLFLSFCGYGVGLWCGFSEMRWAMGAAIPAALPQETAPAETVPAETVPTEVAKPETVPSETVPTETVPTETVPTETVPSEVAKPETVPAEVAKPEGPALIPSGFDEEPTGFSIPVTRLSPEIGRLLMGISLPKDGVIPIFVPTDEHYQPAGEQIYVPLDFYSVLQQQNESSKQVIDGWQLQDATYQMQVAIQPDTQLCVAENFLAIFEFNVVEPDCMLTVPLGGPLWTPQINRLRLDGEPVKGSWIIRDAMLMVPVTKTGHCVLEVPMRMEPVEQLGRFVVSGRIPPIPNAIFDLEISDPRGVHFEIPTASGEQTAEGLGRLRWTLGSTDRLEWSWATRLSSLETTNTEAELDEIQFLRITDSSVETDVVWKFRKLQSPLTCFELECPLDMEMVSLSSAREIGRFTRTARGYLCSFSEAIDPESAITATLQKVVSPRTVISGIGQLRPIPMNVRFVKTTSRLLVIGASPELEVELPQEPPQQNLSTPVSSPSPAFASMTLCGVYDRNTLPDDFTMVVRAKSGTTHVEQRSAYICQKDRVLIEMTAKVQVRNGTSFQYRIDAPAEMEIESIQLLENRLTQPMRWARTPTGTITLFPDAPASSQQEIVLRGWFHVDCPGEWTVPMVRVIGDSRTPDLLEIFRRESIRVAIRSFVGLIPTDAVLTTPAMADTSNGEMSGATSSMTSLMTGRLVAAYREESTNQNTSESTSSVPNASGTATGIVNDNAENVPPATDFHTTDNDDQTATTHSTVDDQAVKSMKLVLAFELNTPRLTGTSWSWLRPVASSGEMSSPESVGNVPRNSPEMLRGGNDFSSPNREAPMGGPDGVGGPSPIDRPKGLGGPPPMGGPLGAQTGRGTQEGIGNREGMSNGSGMDASNIPSLWRLSLLVDVQVDSGVMDTFRIPLPTSWVGPFVCSPSMSIELNENVSTGARYLYVRPTTPVSGQVQFIVTGTLVSRDPRGIPRLPVIRLERGESVVSQAIVPNRYANRDIRWSLPASADCTLPSNIAGSFGISTEAASQYRTMLIPEEMSGSSLITATRRLLRRPPRLPFAELSFSWFEDGSIQGRAAYLIEPGGRTEAELTLPPHAELIAVSVANSVVLAEKVAGNRIRFPFGPPDLPQRVTILWKQNATDAQSSIALASPVWTDFQAERVFWQILAPPGKQMRTPTELQVVRYSEQPLLLLEQLTSLLEIGTEVLRDDSVEATNWGVVWMNDWNRTELWFRHNIAMEPLSTQVQLQYDSLCKRRDAVLARFPEIAKRLTHAAENTPPLFENNFAGQGTVSATDRMGMSAMDGVVIPSELSVRGLGDDTASNAKSRAMVATRDGISERNAATWFNDPTEIFSLSPDPARLRMVSLLELGEARPMVLCAISNGSVQRVEVRYSQIQNESESGNWFFPLLILGMIGVAGYLFWRPNTPVRPRVKNEPIRMVYRDALVLCLVGMFIWVWLRLGMLGAFLVGVAIFQGMNVWRKRRVIRTLPHVPRDE